MPAKRRDTTGKGSGAKARRAKKPPTPPPREESLDSQEPEEVPQEDVPTAEEGTPEGAPSQATRRKEKKARGAFKLKDQEEEAMVIEWVQENRLLWDQKDQNFKNKNQKDRLWAKKAQELGYEGQFLRTWYMDLRDFNTKLQRVQSRDGARVFTAREQWVMGQFQFLKEMIRHRRHRLHSVQSPAAAKAALESGNLEQAERLAAEERRSLEDVDRDSTSSWRSSKRQRGSQEEAEDQYLEVLRKELAESHKRLTALQEREPDDERAAYMKYVGKVVCKTTEDAYEDFQRVFMDWQARWKAQRQQQQQRYQPQQYQQHTTQHQWYSGSSESAQCQPLPHQWRQPTPQMQATSVWGSQSMDFKTNAYPSAVSGGPSPSDSTSLAPPALQHFHRHMVHSVAGDGQAVRLPDIHKSLKTEPTGVLSREEVGPGLHQENSMSLCIKEEPVEEEEQQELPFTIITVKTEEDEDTFSLQEKTEEENKDEDFSFEPGCSSGLLSSLNGTVSSMCSYWFENGTAV